MSAYDRLLEQCLARAEAALEEPGLRPSSDPVQADVRIVVPVYDAPDSLRRCLDAVLGHSPADTPIELLDDASTDQAAIALMRQTAAAEARVQWRRRDRNLGFVGNINAALGEGSDDIVVLTSDTVVHAGWLERLRHAAYAADDVAIACPVSNRATLLTVADSPLVADTDGASLAHACAATASGRYPELPTAVGYCMYVRREAIDRLGRLDDVFAPGYGEEVDYSLRAREAGLRVLACPDCFVEHTGGASFGNDAAIRARRALNERIVHQRWPDYPGQTQQWWRDNPLRAHAERIKTRVLGWRRPDATRLLHVTHSVDTLGGTELFVNGLVERVGRRHPSSLLCVGRTEGWADLEPVRGNANIELGKLNVGYRLVNQYLQGIAADLSNPWTERCFARLAHAGGFGLVHVHYMLGWDSLMLPQLAKRLGLPVVVSLHCFHFVCPDYNKVLRPNLEPCFKPYAGVDSGCHECLVRRRTVAPDADVPALAAYLRARRHFARSALAAADAVVAPSRFTAEAVAEGLDPALHDKIQVIEHGVDPAVGPRAGPEHERLVVGFTGGGKYLKGFALVRALAGQLEGAPIDLHVFGAVDEAYTGAAAGGNVQLHGPVAHERLVATMATLDVLLLPSVFEESFSIALSEAWAAGVVPVASDRGALAERIVDGETGFLLPANDTAAWTQCLHWLAGTEGRRALRAIREQLLAQGVKTMDANAEEYLALYERLMASKPAAGDSGTSRAHGCVDVRGGTQQGSALPSPSRARCEPAQPTAPPRTDAPPVRLAAVVDAGVGEHGASALTATLESLGAQCVCILLIGDGPGSIDNSVNARHIARGDAGTALAALFEVGADWLVWLDAGDRLHPHARDWLSLAAAQAPGSGVIYTDYDHVDVAGRCYAPALKPDRDAALALTTPYAKHGLFAAHAWWQEHAGAALDEDTVHVALAEDLRAAPEAVLHLPKPLYHRFDRNIARDCAPERRRDIGARVVAAAGGDACEIDPARASMGWTPVWPAPRGASVLVRIWGEPDSLAGHQCERALRPASASMRLRVERVGVDRPPPALPEGLGQGGGEGGDTYVLHLHQSVHGIDTGAVARLVGWAHAVGAATVAPRLSQRAGGSLPVGYTASHAGTPEPIAAPDAGGGLDAAALAATASSHSDVPAACVLLRADAFDAETLAAWPTLAPVTRIAAYPRGARAVSTAAVHASVTGGEGAEPLVVHVDQPVAEQPSPAYRDDPWRWPHWRRSRALRPGLRDMPTIGARRRPRVAAVSRDEWAGSQYRVELPLGALCAGGAIEPPVVFRTRREAGPDCFELGLIRADVLVWFNWLDDDALDVLENARAHLPAERVLVIDDLLTELPDYNPYARSNHPDMHARLVRAAAACDRIVVTTEPLAEAYAHLHSDIQVVANALPDRPWANLASARAEPHGRPRIGWAGAAQHDGDLALIEPVIRATAGRMSWVIFGHCPDWLRALVHEVHDPVGFQAYPQALADLDLDVAVAPLVDHPFNHCKSPLKVLEYGALGLPVVASDITPYRNTPVTTVPDDPKAWQSAIEIYASDAAKARADGARLRQWVLSHHLLSQRLPDWRAALGMRGCVHG